MLSANNEFGFFLSNLYFFNSFFLPIAMARTSSKMLYKVLRIDIFLLFEILRRNFQSFITKYYISCRCSHMSFIRLWKCSFTLGLLRIFRSLFNINWCWIVTNIFLHPLRYYILILFLFCWDGEFSNIYFECQIKLAFLG